MLAGTKRFPFLKIYRKSGFGDFPSGFRSNRQQLVCLRL